SLRLVSFCASLAHVRHLLMPTGDETIGSRKPRHAATIILPRDSLPPLHERTARWARTASPSRSAAVDGAARRNAPRHLKLPLKGARQSRNQTMRRKHSIVVATSALLLGGAVIGTPVLAADNMNGAAPNAANDGAPNASIPPTNQA